MKRKHVLVIAVTLLIMIILSGISMLSFGNKISYVVFGASACSAVAFFLTVAFLHLFGVWVERAKRQAAEANKIHKEY